MYGSAGASAPCTLGRYPSAVTASVTRSLACGEVAG